MAGARKREDEPAAVSPARAPCDAEGDEEVLAVGGHGGRQTWLIAAVVGIVAVGGLVAGIGSNRSHHPATQVVPSRSRTTMSSSAPSQTRAPTATSVDIAAACRHPNAIATSSGPNLIGTPNAPSIGPLSFHPDPYGAGYPTRMLIHADRDLTRPVVLRGYRCADHHALRFFYGDPVFLPTPPYTAQQLQATLGSPVAELEAMPAGSDRFVYDFFSSTGQWLIIVTEGSTTLGVLRVDIAHEHEMPTS